MRGRRVLLARLEDAARAAASARTSARELADALEAERAAGRERQVGWERATQPQRDVRAQALLVAGCRVVRRDGVEEDAAAVLDMAERFAAWVSTGKRAER